MTYPTRSGCDVGLNHHFTERVNFTTRTALSHLPGEFGCPWRNAAWALQRRRHQADDIAQTALTFRQLVPICRQPGHPPRVIEHPRTRSPRFRKAPLTLSPHPSAFHGSEGDAYFRTVAGCHSFTTRASSFIGNTSHPTSALILDAIRATGTPGRPPNLHWRSLM